MSTQYILQTLQAILKGNIDEAQATFKEGLQARFRTMINEQSHINYNAWVQDARKRGAKDFKSLSKTDMHAVDSEGRVVGMWQSKHGGFTHKPVGKSDKVDESVETLFEMAVPPDDFREFVDSYIETMIWADKPDEEEWDEGKLAASTLMRIRKDCNDFLSDEQTVAYVNDGSGFRIAGHDFWLTRVGHGAGFWDGDWDEEAGKYLTARAHHFGHLDVYKGDDGKIYLS